MNASTPEPVNPKNYQVGSDSLDCENIVNDEPGDNTVRPPRPELLKWNMAERERLAKLGFNLDGTPIKPPGETDAK